MSGQTKRTPGKWFVQECLGWFEIWSDSDTKICTSNPMPQMTREIADRFLADANLLSAAPELLEALEEFVRIFHKAPECEAALTAIAKARGDR